MTRRLAALLILTQVQVAAAEFIARPPRPTGDRLTADELTDELRRPGDPSSPLHYVRIAVDVSEPGAPTHRLTRKAAAGAAQVWGRMLTDDRRVAPHCIAMPLRRGIACMQPPREEGRHGTATAGLFLHFCRDVGGVSLALVATVTTMAEVRALLTSKVETCKR